jgi:hypothetical protein
MRQMRISTTQVSSVMHRNPKKMWKLKEPSDENHTECREIEPNPAKDRAMPEVDNPSITNFTFVLTVQFIFEF